MKTFIKYSLIAFSFCGCNGGFKDTPNGKTSTVPLDTINTRLAINISPVVFEAAFIKGTVITTRKTIFNSYGINIGKIKITSGKLITCDPLHIDEYGTPLTKVFPTGEFPVQLAIARLEDEEVVAFARINFSDEPVAKWEMALNEKQKAVPFGQDDIKGYSTDSWTGLFIDTAAYRSIDKEQILREDGTAYKELEKNRRKNWRYAMYNFGDHNAALFSTGYQDGYYATYIGYDAKGNICRLVTDFDLFDWRKK